MRARRPRRREGQMEIGDEWRHLANKRMAEKLTTGEAKDVGPYRTQTGFYELPPGFFEVGLDYCDASREAWIWSIGRELTAAGRVFASTGNGLYQNPRYECLWLR